MSKAQSYNMRSSEQLSLPPGEAEFGFVFVYKILNMNFNNIVSFKKNTCPKETYNLEGFTIIFLNIIYMYEISNNIHRSIYYK